jgi:hypothetical protein
MIDEAKEAMRVYQNSIRARQLGLPATLTLDEWLAMSRKFDGMCAYCRIRPFEVLEHMEALGDGSRGTTRDNCIPACYPCNAKKSHYVITLKGSTVEENIEEVLRCLETSPTRSEFLQRPTEQISIRFPLDLYEQIDRLAKEGDRSYNAQVIRLLRERLEELASRQKGRN